MPTHSPPIETQAVPKGRGEREGAPQPAPSEDRKRQIREAVARHKARMDRLSRLEQLAWKFRDRLGEDFDPYTREERKEMERIRRGAEKLQKDAQALQDRIMGRLGGLEDGDPVGELKARLETAKGVQIVLPPH